MTFSYNKIQLNYQIMNIVRLVSNIFFTYKKMIFFKILYYSTQNYSRLIEKYNILGIEFKICYEYKTVLDTV